MEIRRLLYFSRIAEDGSLTKAAGVLRIAQPALSRQLRLLEEELGVSLFTRGARGVRLTREGEYLRDAAEGPLRALEFALQTVRSLASGPHGNLTIGIPPNLGEHLSTRLVLQLRSQFPGIKLRIVEGATGSLIDWLNRRIIDCALVEDATRDERLVDIPLLSEPLVVVGGMGSDLSAERPVSIARLLRLPLILPSHHLGIRATVNQAATKARISLTPHIEADSTRLILDLVQRGDGYTLLPHFLFERQAREGELKWAPVTTPELRYCLFLSQREDERWPNPAIAEGAVDTLRQLLSESPPGIPELTNIRD